MRPFDAVRRLLDRAGRNGPVLLFFGVLTGVALPPLAELARPLMGVAIFCFTLGAFLKVDGTSFRAEAARPVLLAALLVWATLGVPVLGLVLARLLGAEGAAAQGLVLGLLAPPVASAAAVAVMLGLSAPLAFIASISATLLAPLSLPLLAAWAGGPRLSLDPSRMMLVLLLIIGGAGLAAALLRRPAGDVISGNPQVMTGIAVAGLLLLAVGAMRGMQPRLLADPRGVGVVLAVAFAMNIGLQGLGTLLFLRFGAAEALTAGLVGGNRNVALAWAAAGPGLPPESEIALAMGMFPVFMLPVLYRWLIPRPAELFLRLAPQPLPAAMAAAAVPMRRRQAGD